MKKLIFLFSLFLLTSCSSVLRYTALGDDHSCSALPYIYGGIALDMAPFAEGMPKRNELHGDVNFIMKINGVVDFPFSLIGDTILLPVAIPMHYKYPKSVECDAKNS